MKKIPWGILAGVAAMVVFFATAAVVILFVVLNGVAGQTNGSTTIFGTWYQTLIFVIDIIGILAFSGALTIFILKALGKLPEKKEA